MGLNGGDGLGNKTGSEILSAIPRLWFCFGIIDEHALDEIHKNPKSLDYPRFVLGGRRLEIEFNGRDGLGNKTGREILSAIPRLWFCFVILNENGLGEIYKNPKP